MKPPVCDECAKEGRKPERIYDNNHAVATSFLASIFAPLIFWDADGKQHCHDPNGYTQHCRCCNGHEWSETYKKPCWCETETGEAK